MILEWTEQATECLAVQYDCTRCSLGALGYKKPRCKVHNVVKWMVLNGKLPHYYPELKLSKLLKAVIHDLRRLPIEVVAEKHNVSKSDLLRAITAWANGQKLSKREAIIKLSLPTTLFRYDWLGR
jgi:hypothetical protein